MSDAPPVPFLELHQATVRLGERAALEGVSLGVSAGELCVLLGPNGAGKSTLLRAVLRLVAMASGEVRLAGRPVGEWTRPEFARQVAWVPQQLEPADGMSGLELVLLGRTPHQGLWGLPGRSDEAQVRAALERLGVSHLADRPCTEMSGGERRLLLLARAEVQAPRLLLLDEPTAFLDLRHQLVCLQRVRALVDEGCAALVVLHDPNLAAAFADQVVLLREGRVHAKGPVASALSSSTLEEVFGVPMTSSTSAEGQRLFAPRAAQRAVR